MFTFKLEQEDGTPADPPTLHTAVPNWQIGDTIPLGADKVAPRDRESGPGVMTTTSRASGRGGPGLRPEGCGSSGRDVHDSAM